MFSIYFYLSSLTSMPKPRFSSKPSSWSNSTRNWGPQGSVSKPWHPWCQPRKIMKQNLPMSTKATANLNNAINNFNQIIFVKPRWSISYNINMNELDEICWALITFFISYKNMIIELGIFINVRRRMIIWNILNF